jgi:hypothetical protein
MWRRVAAKRGIAVGHELSLVTGSDEVIRSGAPAGACCCTRRCSVVCSGRWRSAEGGEHFDDLALIPFDQAVPVEGGQLEYPAAYVQRVNRMLAG